MGLIFVNAAGQQITLTPSGARTPPAGFTYSGGSDGATDRVQQTFWSGIVSGGWPAYGFNAGETVKNGLLRGDGTLAAYGPSGHA